VLVECVLSVAVHLTNHTHDISRIRATRFLRNGEKYYIYFIGLPMMYQPFAI